MNLAKGLWYSLIIMLALATVMGVAASATQRVVLAELFGATW
jgi:hypothetical protein